MSAGRGSADGEAGLSLPEMLVALTLAGLVAAAAVGVLRSQQEFYARSSDRVHARQSARAAADLLASELGAAGPADLMAAEPESVSVRRDVLRGVVCGPVDAVGEEVAVYAFDTVTNPNLPAGFRGHSYLDPVGGAGRHVDSAPLVTAPGAGASTCTSRGAPASGEPWRYRTVGGWLAPGSFGAVPPRGAVVTRYGRLTFSLEASPSYPDAAGIRRNSQELVAPFADGARFRYVLDDGSVLPSVPPSDLGRVRAIRLAATALGPRPRSRAESELRLAVFLQR